jgi:hypothetical protein
MARGKKSPPFLRAARRADPARRSAKDETIFKIFRPAQAARSIFSINLIFCGQRLNAHGNLTIYAHFQPYTYLNVDLSSKKQIASNFKKCYTFKKALFSFV